MQDFSGFDKREINEILPSLTRGASVSVGLRMSVEKLHLGPSPDPLRALAEYLPRPFRFLAVGAVGLTTDLCAFTLLMGFAPRPLVMRLFSLAVATLVTWRLNRALTFDKSGRTQGEEALRYAAVTAASQGTSYAVFAAMVLTVLGGLPQAAIIIGAAIGALVAYNGHRLFAFAPRVPQ
jgi:putative flippase GtrA